MASAEVIQRYSSQSLALYICVIDPSVTQYLWHNITIFSFSYSFSTSSALTIYELTNISWSADDRIFIIGLILPHIFWVIGITVFHNHLDLTNSHNTFKWINFTYLKSISWMVCKQQIYVDLSLDFTFMIIVASKVHINHQFNFWIFFFCSANLLLKSCSAFKLTATLNFFSGYKKRKLINKSITITI